MNSLSIVIPAYNEEANVTRTVEQVSATAQRLCTDYEIHRLMALTSTADIVCGYRAGRQDPFIRKLNACGWNVLVRLLFGCLSRDIDCGFKLFRRAVLDFIPLNSKGAMVDTEFLAGAKARGFRIAETPVTHLPRLAGEPTGANLHVIVKAFRDLVRFRLRLTRELKAAKQADQIYDPNLSNTSSTIKASRPREGT